MDRPLTKKPCQYWPKLALVFVLIYFSQIYPYVHFHHAHDDHGLPVEVSMHPIDVRVDDFDDHHDDGHHHHTFDQRTDARAVRAGSRYTAPFIDVPVFRGCLTSIPTDEPESYAKVYTNDALPDSVPLESSICRGPPELS